jgi:hypothetical protein
VEARRFCGPEPPDPDIVRRAPAVGAENRSGSFQEEYMGFFQKSGIEYDEYYLW